jgi:hypothetical protein
MHYIHKEIIWIIRLYIAGLVGLLYLRVASADRIRARMKPPRTSIYM